MEDRRGGGGEEEIGQGHTNGGGKGFAQTWLQGVKGQCNARIDGGRKEPTREKIRRFERYRAWGPKVGQGKRRDGRKRRGNASRTV